MGHAPAPVSKLYAVGRTAQSMWGTEGREAWAFGVLNVGKC